ncbi:MAG TPA: LLM class F420-dependent oxidoreductase [Candidatus Binataceae bacterium]|nr:LLM class F420-dependent oxidoreductase [Candidatus Binataceae bacterium]
MRLGITIPLEGFQNRGLIDLVRRAEALGYTDLWSMESFGNDAFSPLAAAAAVTERLRLGTAIVPVFTRPPALTAMSSATVQQISNGRLILGLGISTPVIVDQWMGVPFKKPVTLMRETVEALRAIFAKNRVVMNGKTIRINGFRLDFELETPPPIFIGAQGPKMLRLAGEIGDGMITNFITPETLPSMLEHVKQGALAAGKDPSKQDVVVRIVTVVDEDIDQTRTELRRYLTAYVTVPQYNQFFRGIGFEHEAAEAIAAWNAGDRKKALECVSDKMVESILVFGSADQCRKRLEAYDAAGVKTVTLWLSSFARDPEKKRASVLHAMEALAPR